MSNLKKFAPAAERNQFPIVETMKNICQKYSMSIDNGHGLEISSGTGQHITKIAEAFPSINWQPSEYNIEEMDSIQAYIQESQLTNIQLPIQLDASTPYTEWGIEKNSMDIIVNINMIHIAPIEACHGLFKGVGHVLKSKGLFFMYGPFQFQGIISPESNVKFQESLKQRCADWGLREIEDIKILGSNENLQHVETISMPANNHILVFQKL